MMKVRVVRTETAMTDVLREVMIVSAYLSMQCSYFLFVMHM
jgi:hypothetical protein